MVERNIFEFFERDKKHYIHYIYSISKLFDNNDASTILYKKSYSRLYPQNMTMSYCSILSFYPQLCRPRWTVLSYVIDNNIFIIICIDI